MLRGSDGHERPADGVRIRHSHCKKQPLRQTETLSNDGLRSGEKPNINLLNCGQFLAFEYKPEQFFHYSICLERTEAL